MVWLFFNCLFFFPEKEGGRGWGDACIQNLFIPGNVEKENLHSVAAAPLGALLSLYLLALSLPLTLNSILTCQAALSKHSRRCLSTVILSYPFHYISRELATRWDPSQLKGPCLFGRGWRGFGGPWGSTWVRGMNPQRPLPLLVGSDLDDHDSGWFLCETGGKDTRLFHRISPFDTVLITLSIFGQVKIFRDFPK